MVFSCTGGEPGISGEKTLYQRFSTHRHERDSNSNLCVDKHYKLIRIQYIPDIVRCVDIGGIDDHHCLNFLFIETTFITKQI